MLDGAARLGELFDEAEPAGPAGHRDHRPRVPVRRVRLLEEGQGRTGSSRSSASRPTSRRAPAGTTRAACAGARRTRRRRRLRRRRVHPHDAAGHEQRGHAQPVPDVVPGLPRGPVRQVAAAWTASCCSTYCDGPDRHHRLPVGRGPDPAAARASTTRPCGPPASSRTSSARTTSSRADGPRARHRDAGSPRTCCALAEAIDAPAGGHERPALHASSEDATRTRPCCAIQSGSTAGRPRTRFKFDAERLLPEVRRRRCGAPGPRLPGGVRQHAAHRRAVRGRVQHRGQLHAALPRARRARTRRPGSSRRSRPGLHVRYPGGIPDDVRTQADYETEVITQHGLPGVLPRGRRLHQLGQEQRHPRRSRAWVRRRVDGGLRHAHHRPRPAAARPDLRAVPQPGPRLHARLRRRLRRAPPRRGHPVRHREVRRRPRRP